ncbi:MAG TPA: hypothetical protein VHJ19_02475 [Gammaproteobacteria bacterium]|nr:hypothetical protein [Gammaproteobacteria bacterium]
METYTIRVGGSCTLGRVIVVLNNGTTANDGSTQSNTLVTGSPAVDAVTMVSVHH